MMLAVAKLSAASAKEDFANTEVHLQHMANEICGAMDKVRIHADALEGVVADDMWPLATYEEMLFIK
jgi:glutamine synthetase